MIEKQRTQAERREKTHKIVLESACLLFGEKGYANTSLEDIAQHCGVTTRPVYHYFGNKKALFAAVNDLMEERIIEAIASSLDGDGSADIIQHWLEFQQVCEDPLFRRIVLIDSPNILGRERWSNGKVTTAAKKLFGIGKPKTRAERYQAELFRRIIMGAFTEAALMIAEADDRKTAKKQAEIIIRGLFS